MLEISNFKFQISRELVAPRRVWIPIAAMVVTLGLTGSCFADESAGDPAPENATWVTSIAPLGSTGDFVAGTANSLLLREASVVSFDPNAPAELTTLYSHPAAVWCVATTNDGSTVASVDYRGNLVLFDHSGKSATTHEKAFERWCQTLVISPDEKFVVAGNEAGKVLAWNIDSQEVTKSAELDGHAVTDITFSPEGNRIAASDGDGHIHLLKWPELESIGMIQISDQPAWCVSFVESGKRLLVGSSDRNLYRVDAKADAKPKSIAKGSDWITELVVSPSGQVAAGEVGGRVLFPSMASPAGSRVDAMNAKSGVWALHWNGNEQLLVGTRKHGVLAASRSWKWATPEQTPRSHTQRDDTTEHQASAEKDQPNEESTDE